MWNRICVTNHIPRTYVRQRKKAEQDATRLIISTATAADNDVGKRIEDGNPKDSENLFAN